MKPRNAVIGLSIFLLTLFLMGARTDAMAAGPCYSTNPKATIFQLAPEIYSSPPNAGTLNSLYSCIYKYTLSCPDAGYQQKQISGYGNPGDIYGWLVQTSNPNSTYTNAQQIAIVNNAVSIAKSNVPPHGSIHDIQFFRDEIVSNNAGYFVGANVTYLIYCGHPYTGQGTSSNK